MNQQIFFKTRLVAICCLSVLGSGFFGCDRTHSQEVDWQVGSRVQFREHVEMRGINGTNHQIPQGSVGRLQKVVNGNAHVLLFDVIGSTSINNLELAEEVVLRAFSEVDTPVADLPRESIELVNVGVVGGFVKSEDWPQQFAAKRKQLRDDFSFVEHAYRVATNQLANDSLATTALGERVLNDCRTAYLSALTNPSHGLEKIDTFCETNPQDAQALIWRMIIRLLVIVNSRDTTQASLDLLRKDYITLKSLNVTFSLPAMIMSMAELKSFEQRSQTEDATTISFTKQASLKKARKYYEIARSFDKYDPMIDELEVSLRLKELETAEAGADPESVTDLKLALYRDLVTMIDRHPYRQGFLALAAGLENQGIHTLRPADEVAGNVKNRNLMWGRTRPVYNFLSGLHASTEQFHYRSNSRAAMPRLPGHLRWQVNTAPSILRNSEEPWTSLLPRPLNEWRVLPAAYGCLTHTEVVDYQSAVHIQKQDPLQILCYLLLQTPTLTLDLKAIDERGFAVVHAFKDNPTLWAFIANEHNIRVKVGRPSQGIDFDYPPRHPTSGAGIEDDFVRAQREIGERIKDRLITQAEQNSAQGAQARELLSDMEASTRLRLNKLNATTLGEQVITGGSQFQRYTAFVMGYQPSEEYLKALCHDCSVKLDPNLSLAQQWRPIAISEVRQELEQAYQRYKTFIHREAVPPTEEAITGHRLYLENVAKMRIGGSSIYMRALEEIYLADIRAGRNVDPVAQYETDKQVIRNQRLNSRTALNHSIQHIPQISGIIGGQEAATLVKRAQEITAEIE